MTPEQLEELRALIQAWRDSPRGEEAQCAANAIEQWLMGHGDFERLTALLSLASQAERMREALEFYRDNWEDDCDAQLIGPGVWDGGSVSRDPSEALLSDKGERARAALEEKE